MRVLKHTHTHTCSDTHTHRHTRSDTHTHRHTHTCSDTHTHRHTHTHNQTHTHTHAHISTERYRRASQHQDGAVQILETSIITGRAARHRPAMSLRRPAGTQGPQGPPRAPGVGVRGDLLKQGVSADLRPLLLIFLILFF